MPFPVATLGSSLSQSDLPSSRLPLQVEAMVPQGQSFDARKVYDSHIEQLVKQETRDHYLPTTWNQLIIATANMLCEDVQLNLHKSLNVQHDSTSSNPSQQFSLIDDMALQEFCPSKFSPMHILRYVHIKKVSLPPLSQILPCLADFRRCGIMPSLEWDCLHCLLGEQDPTNTTASS